MEDESPASACGEAVAAACDNAAAGKVVDRDSTPVDAAVASCSNAVFRDVDCEIGIAVDAACDETAVGIVEFGFTIMQRFDCARVEKPLSGVVKTYLLPELMLTNKGTGSGQDKRSVGSFSNPSTKSQGFESMPSQFTKAILSGWKKSAERRPLPVGISNQTLKDLPFQHCHT